MRFRLPYVRSIVVLGLCGALGACHAASNPHISGAAREWLEGPTKWLLLEDEGRAFRRLRSNRDTITFMESFWRRRDPDPGDSENPFYANFVARVRDADALYAETGKRGSLTDRGRVLILFGPPSKQRIEQKAVPALSLDRNRPGQKSWVRREVWAYLPAELPPSFLDTLPEAGRVEEIQFVFVEEGRRTYLLSGESYCEIAARAAAREE